MSRDTYLPPAFFMWKMCHKTITTLFKNLDTAENNIQVFINTLSSSTEFSYVFIPGYESSISFEQNIGIEKTYQSFTTWLLGRLFYLLSCERLERIHNLIIKVTNKVLTVLKLNQPHFFNTIIQQYDNSLTLVNNFLESFSKNPVTINNFTTDPIVFNEGELELTPMFVELQNDSFCYSLQGKLLKILLKFSLVYIESLDFGITSKSILQNFKYCLKNSNSETKLIIFEYYTELIRESYFQINKFTMTKEIFSCLTDMVANVRSENSNFTLEEKEIFDSILLKMLEIINELKIYQDDNFLLKSCENICYLLIDYNLQSQFENKLVLFSTMVLLKNILTHTNQSYLEIDKIVNYSIKNKNCYDTNILMQYQIVEEIKNSIDDNSVNVLINSKTWKSLYENSILLLDSSNDNTIQQNLLFVKSVTSVAKFVYLIIREKCFKVMFFPLQEFLLKIKKNLNNQQNLDLITDIFANILIFHHFEPVEIQNLKTIIEIICHPFSNIQGLSITIKHLTPGSFPDQTKKQIKAFEILSTSLINVELVEKPYVNEIKNWIITILKFCANSQNSDILLQIPDYFIYFVCTLKGSTPILIEVLKQLLSNPQLIKILSDSLGIIICAISSSYIIDRNLSENYFFYDVLCKQCDFTKNQNNFCRISNNKEYNLSEFQKNQVTNVDYSMIVNLLDYKENDAKINIVKQLPRFIIHIKEFSNVVIIKKWFSYIEDENLNVRQNFVSILKIVLNNYQDIEHLKKYKETVRQTCLEFLSSLSQKYFRSGNAEILETILDTIKIFGCLQNWDTLYTTTKLIIPFLILCNTHLCLTANDYLQQIAKTHKITPNFLYSKYKKSFSQGIANMSVYAYLAMEYNIVQSLERISLAFDYRLKDFISKNIHHLLPYIFPYFVKTAKSEKILVDLANYMVTEPFDLISANFSYIYTYIYLYEDEDTFKNCLKYIERSTKENIYILKKRNISFIHSELLLHFHDKNKLVMKAFHQLSLEESDSNSEISRSSDVVQQISDYLQPRFLGVLVYFDSKLVSKNIDDSIKIRILKSLPLIIKLMGTKYITPLRHKVLATLRTMLSLTERQHLELTCDNWEAFIRCCEIESLGPLLSTIFISVLTLIELFPKKINSILKYLVIENKEKLKDYFQDLFLLTETKVDKELEIVVKSHIASDQMKSCKDKLMIFLKYISHENLEVRVFGLKSLKKYLEEKHEKLEELILGNNGMDDVLVEVIEILIAGCRENDEEVRLACGQCIGELGAIEPSHFPRKYTTQSDTTFTFFITDDNFVINALLELLRSFQMEKHTQTMNRHALAIQEILKVYGVSPEETAPKHNIWLFFPENLQELMLPLLSSRYTVAIHNSDKISTHPIFGTHIGSSFNDWIFNWASFLISLLKNEKQTLLQVCKPSLKSDNKTLMTFLPHILIHALLECSNLEREVIFDEFMAVLNHSLKINEGLNLTKKSDDTSKNNCIKVIFLLLDFMDRWLREYEYTKCPKSSNPISNPQYKIIHTFVSQFCKLKIAQCNFLRGEYPRALMYLEQYVISGGLNEHLDFFARIYAELEESDGVTGVMAMKQTDPSVEEMILAHTVSGQLQDAAACYERMAQEQTLKPEYLQDMVKCYLELDNPFTALKLASGAMEKYSEYKTMLYESQSEPFWRLGMYDDLDELLKRPEMKNNNSWGVRVGQALLHFRNGNRFDFQNEVGSLQKMLVEMLSITSLEEGVYRHGYPNIIKLHILNELQKAEEIVYKLKDTSDQTIAERLVKELDEEWNVRLKVVQDSVRVVEPILRLRRIILEQAQHVLGSHGSNIKPTLDNHIAKYWLKSAEIARRFNIFQQAYIYILKADQYKPMELFIEKAKLYWAKEEQDLAFSTLKRGIEEYFPDAVNFKEMASSVRKSERKLCAEAKLLIATYNDETANVDMDINITNYREAVEMYREWEKSQVCLAQYYDRVFSTMSDADKDLKGGDIQIHIINSFGKSLQYGSTYIYQSMPRMLSIWLDYGTRIVEKNSTDDKTTRESKKTTLFKMIKLMDTYLDRLPAYMFLSAFSQLVSRICHPVREVYIQIKSILIKLILKYPQQSMWMILSVSKSAYAMRTKRCQEVLQDPQIKNSRIITLIYDFNRLAEKLIELCNKPISDGVLNASVNTLIRTLPRLLQNKEFSQIMIPVQKLRKLILPNSEYSNNQYNPFPNKLIYIIGIEDEIQVLQSLQRPRKITFIGSDGKKYLHMLKPKDDLRKDYRLMEFNDVVNLYLHREAESRQRRLCIRTYSVVPLNEECGIIEWVDNLVGLRPILMKIYKQKGLFVSARELKSMMCNIRDPLSKKREVFEKFLLPKHPPVLSEWFRRSFPDAHCWFHARSAYVRTSAVVSMVGYVLGLGDRHGENILFDSTNGDTVHVDFNCLFNKGETFDWPERVPFRLTQNMVDAMGPLGVEGIFRRTCAVTLKVLRTHTDTLMSIVRPFVYDPLVSWPRNQMLKTDLAEAERTNEQAVEHIRNIELRLQGMIKTRGKAFSISLSCEGQANNLILEATSVDNLSQMYIGWGPYL